MTTLDYVSVRKTFGPTTALIGLDLGVREGELISLLGPSGCGKTTALRIAAGFEYPDSGAVLLSNADITRTPAHKRNMGMVFQSYSLFPNLTVANNVDFGLRTRKMSAPDRHHRVAEMLDLVQLTTHGQPLPAPALGRPAAARRPRASAGHQAAGAAARRAAVRARRQGARLAARRDPPHPDRARHHDPVRHPRPGGSAGDLRPRRRDVERQPRAARHARPRCTATRRARSSPASSDR